ncbi:TetR family transcriptional regulator [Sporosarcina sp. P13]|uniref:TetR/AcrR family transcriptional regulator n=1 Tax=Sporosarcina sp. P13 TaxID=2048263 RepID=UPI000C16B3FE|nr:TetR/AcrR family transcriptional regulator [Sporosarcina sp. P13]PIC63492.1 TetR family transcriptional regulator [Sporosarcina sp. P13]
MVKKRDIKVKRMLEFFIEATEQVIEKEGVQHVTARKIADLAGYTSSTIYNYFEELNHLIFFGSLRFLDEYITDLSKYIDREEEPLEKYLSSWECFCKHSYNNPQIYNVIFISDLGSELNELLKRYYKIYPNDLLKLPEEIKMLVMENDLSKRSKGMLHNAVQNKHLSDESLEAIVDITILMWKGMLTTLLNNRTHYTPEQATAITMNYIREIMSHYTK